MSNLQIIEALTDIVSKQSEIIRIQADALAQVGAVCAEEQIVSVDLSLIHISEPTRPY